MSIGSSTPALFKVPSIRTALFRALVGAMQSNVVLNSVVRSWRTWEGEDNDAAEPGIDELPWVRITPQGQPAQARTIGVSEIPWTLQIETMVAGTRIDDALDLWSAFENALFPGDGTMQTLMNANSAYQMILGTPQFGPGETTDSIKTMRAVGTLAVYLRLNTRL